MSKALEFVRSAVIRWANSVVKIEEFETLPAHVFGLEPAASNHPVSAEGAVNGTAVIRRRRRVRKHKSQDVTLEVSAKVREVMHGLKADTEEYIAKRDELCKEYSLSRRQIASIASGPARGAKRKKK